MMLGRVKNDGTLYSFMTYKEVYDETSDESSRIPPLRSFWSICWIWQMTLNETRKIRARL